jgi:hypothetical protein
MRVFIGCDPKEERAAEVAAKSLRRVSGIEAEFLRADKLRAQGLFTRVEDARGQRYDFASQAPCSTEFSNLRFLTPLLAHVEWALFVDCDVVFLRDPREMLAEIEPGRAVYVVRHAYTPKGEWKMVNQQQTTYPFKNSSSVALFSPAHPANLRLNLACVNTMPGRWLHAFSWLHDEEVGYLDPAWNWLVDETPRPANLGIAHLTLGGPYLPGWKGGSFDEEWLVAEAA